MFMTIYDSSNAQFQVSRKQLNTAIMSIKQWVSDLKGLDGLQLRDAAMPSPGHGEVLVEIRAISLNFRDTEGKSRHGLSEFIEIITANSCYV